MHPTKPASSTASSSSSTAAKPRSEHCRQEPGDVPSRRQCHPASATDENLFKETCHGSADRIHRAHPRTARRRSAIDELWTEDAILYVPPGPIFGREAIDKFAGDLRATHPHFVYTPHGQPQVLHNAGRLAWGSGPRGEAPVYTGCDVIIVRDGRIAALYVFLDESPEEFRRASGQAEG
nr:nuclear transport factor 2 family protein [Beijerinckia indica]